MWLNSLSRGNRGCRVNHRRFPSNAALAQHQWPGSWARGSGWSLPPHLTREGVCSPDGEGEGLLPLPSPIPAGARVVPGTDSCHHPPLVQRRGRTSPDGRGGPRAVGVAPGDAGVAEPRWPRAGRSLGRQRRGVTCLWGGLSCRGGGVWQL